jgi:hypothetical protein
MIREEEIAKCKGVPQVPPLSKVVTAQEPYSSYEAGYGLICCSLVTVSSFRAAVCMALCHVLAAQADLYC